MKINRKLLLSWVLKDILASEFLKVVNNRSTIYNTNLNAAKPNADKRAVIRGWIAELHTGMRIIVGPPALSQNANSTDVTTIINDLTARERGARVILATY